MPGIKTGDLGPKFGFNGKDNGWMTLDHVRIPRDQMMQKFIEIDREGSLSMKGDIRMMYSVMLNTRVELMTLTRVCLGYALTIALRYSAVRRQFKNISGQKLETKLLDY